MSSSALGNLGYDEKTSRKDKRKRFGESANTAVMDGVGESVGWIAPNVSLNACLVSHGIVLPGSRP